MHSYAASVQVTSSGHAVTWHAGNHLSRLPLKVFLHAAPASELGTVPQVLCIAAAASCAPQRPAGQQHLLLPGALMQPLPGHAFERSCAKHTSRQCSTSEHCLCVCYACSYGAKPASRQLLELPLSCVGVWGVWGRSAMGLPARAACRPSGRWPGRQQPRRARGTASACWAAWASRRTPRTPWRARRRGAGPMKRPCVCVCVATS